MRRVKVNAAAFAFHAVRPIVAAHHRDGDLCRNWTSNWSPHEILDRDLFLVTVIAALAVGWWVDRRRLAAELDRLELDQVAGEIWVELGSDPHGWKKTRSLSGSLLKCSTLRHPPQTRLRNKK